VVESFLALVPILTASQQAKGKAWSIQIWN